MITINNQDLNPVWDKIWSFGILIKIDKYQIPKRTLYQELTQISNWVWNQVYNNISNEVWHQVCDTIYVQINDQIWTYASNPISSNLAGNIDTNI